MADDREPVLRLLIVGVEAQGLAKEDGGGFVLIPACGELAQQAIGRAALGIESDDVSEIGLRLELAPQGDLRTRTHHEERYALGLIFERVVAHRHDTWIMATFEQLLRSCKDSTVHNGPYSKRWASRQL